MTNDVCKIGKDIYIHNNTLILQSAINKTQISVLTIPIPYTVGHHAGGQLSVEAIFDPRADNYRHTITIKLLPLCEGRRHMASRRRNLL
jgi:hypothetical protein